MHVDAVKEFYARLTLVHYKKNDVARSKIRGVDIEFDHLRLASILGVPGHKGICEYIKDVWEESKNTKPLKITRKRDDEEAAPAENEEVAEDQPDFQWEAVVDETALQGESGSDDQFYDAQVEVEELIAEALAVLVFPASPGDSTNQQQEPEAVGVDPSGPTGHILDSVMSKLQVEFEKARANKI
ncbi:hypothetical protein Dimus_029435 [Dionaea muscipula]